VLAELPLGPLTLLPGPAVPLQADGELLAAALLNLLDNAQRHGGQTLQLQADGDNGLCLHNDGKPLPDATRLGLQAALQAEDDGESGLGLRLADLVARAHGGHLELPATPTGFAVTLHFGPRA
jgi:signal transduction histidine kinase